MMPAKGKKNLEPGIEVRHGRIHLTTPELLDSKPMLLMRLFAQSAKTGVPIHHRTQKTVSSNLDLIDRKAAPFTQNGSKPFLALLERF